MRRFCKHQPDSDVKISFPTAWVCVCVIHSNHPMTRIFGMLEVLFGMAGEPQAVELDRCDMIHHRHPAGKQLLAAADRLYQLE